MPSLNALRRLVMPLSISPMSSPPSLAGLFRGGMFLSRRYYMKDTMHGKVIIKKMELCRKYRVIFFQHLKIFKNSKMDDNEDNIQCPVRERSEVGYGDSWGEGEKRPLFLPRRRSKLAVKLIIIAQTIRLENYTSTITITSGDASPICGAIPSEKIRFFGSVCPVDLLRPWWIDKYTRTSRMEIWMIAVKSR